MPQGEIGTCSLSKSISFSKKSSGIKKMIKSYKIRNQLLDETRCQIKYSNTVTKPLIKLYKQLILHIQIHLWAHQLKWEDKSMKM